MGIINLTVESFDEAVSGPHSLVLFSSERCRPCRTVAPIIEELAEQFEGRMNFAKVNTEIERDLLKRFNIMTVPLVIIFENGKEINRLSGVQSKEDYLAII